jgi:hypothetical protein
MISNSSTYGRRAVLKLTGGNSSDDSWEESPKADPVE